MGDVNKATDADMRACAAEWADQANKLLAENVRLRGLLRAILAADERGQGLGYAEAMAAAAREVRDV